MIEIVKEEILKNLENKTNEFKRVFHGRGCLFEQFEFLTVDSVNDLLFVAFYDECEQGYEEELIEFFKTIAKQKEYKTVVLQRRYLQNSPSEVLYGKIKEDSYIAYENGLKYYLNIMSHQNIGFFADMKKGREFVLNNSKDKNVLNLFSYTCSFSVSSISGGAKQVVNVDMSKQALSVGRQNHHLNSLDTSKVKFLPYNILKSWSKIKKYAPYDLIIIDPPSFQKGSFIATKDYKKIVKRLSELCNSDATVLACLNEPKLQEEYLKELFKQNACNFKYEKTLEENSEFKSKEGKQSLKCLVFKLV